LTDCVTLWIGDRLGPVERACLLSVLRQGHSLALYCYRIPAGVPQGVEVRDASEVLPKDRIFTHWTGSVGVFADWFRYELQRRGLGTWLDTDNYLIAPIDLQRPYLFGEYEPGKIANGVVRLPADSRFVGELLELFENPTTPSWLPWRPYLAAKLREMLTGKAALSKMPWGTTGPFAMTAIAKRLGLASEALPSKAFNPVPWRQAEWILDPERTLEEAITDRTVGVHLWNQCIRDYKDKPAPAGSFLHRLQREGAE
jgi:hypothetical protein